MNKADRKSRRVRCMVCNKLVETMDVKGGRRVKAHGAPRCAGTLRMVPNPWGASHRSRETGGKE